MLHQSKRVACKLHKIQNIGFDPRMVATCEFEAELNRKISRCCKQILGTVPSYCSLHMVDMTTRRVCERLVARERLTCAVPVKGNLPYRIPVSASSHFSAIARLI